MTTRIRKRPSRRTFTSAPRIEVVDRSRELPCHRLSFAMEVLQVHDYATYLQVIELAEGYASIHINPLESRADFDARLARTIPEPTGAN